MYYNPESMNIPNFFWRVTVALLLLVSAFPLSAQTTSFFVEDATTDTASEVLVNVRGIDIESVVGVQLSLSWDVEALDFLGVTNIAMDGSLDENFNQTKLDTGRIGYLEVDGSLMGFDLPDSTVLFSLRFQPRMSVGLETTISFDSIPFKTSANDSDNNRLDPELKPGTVTIEGPSSVSVFAEDPRFTVAPNPVHDLSQLRLQLNYGGQATLELLTIEGRRLRQQPYTLRPGANTFELNARDFGADGTYIVRITTDREQLHRKVIVRRNGR